MSDTTLNDKELFESAISDTPSVEVVTPEPATEAPAKEATTDDGVPRDDKGRFAPKVAEEPEPVKADVVPPVTGQQPDNAAQVPSWRLREVNEEREAAIRRATDAEARAQAAERQYNEFRKQNEPKPEPIDFYTDPQGAFKQQLSPFEERMQSMQANFNLRASKAEALAIHGKDAVAELEKAVEEAMRANHPDMRLLRTQMQNSEDPVGVAMQWHQREKLLKETGGDISAYKTRLQDDLLKDPAFLAKAMEAAKAQASGQAPNGKPNTTVQLPPSLNRAPSAASPHEDQGDGSDHSLYAFAIR